MKSNRSIRRKGFTLVELLIVIVVIGILSAMMMLSSTEAVTSAKANNIISNLRNWKTATLEWYTDNIDRVTADGKVKKSDGTGEDYFSKVVKAKDIMPYLGSGMTVDGDKVKDSSGGIFTTDYINNRDWSIVYEIPNPYKDDARLLSKIEAKAQSIGIRNYMKDRNSLYKVQWNGSKPTNSYKLEIMVVDFSK